MPKIDVQAIPVRRGSNYPAQFAMPMAGRTRRRLGDAGGLTQFGVNLMHLAPGAWSSQRHWHAQEDEFVYVLDGEVVLVTDEGEQVLRAGDCAAFPRGAPNGHHLVNRSAGTAVCLEVGARRPQEQVLYCDIDLRYDRPPDAYAHKDGTPYPGK
jgi:uncharacterized cupin superfamily protein